MVKKRQLNGMDRKVTIVLMVADDNVFSEHSVLPPVLAFTNTRQFYLTSYSSSLEAKPIPFLLEVITQTACAKCTIYVLI